MERNEIYNGKVCGYWKVQDIKDEKMLVACEKAVEVILSHDWHDMHYEKGTMYPRAEFEVEETGFENCKVFIINDEGEIIFRFCGNFSKEDIFDDFEIDLRSHPKVQKRQYSYEAYLKDKYSKK
ncbi:MAG: hypothetical protein HFJ41_05560 [Clostridia bacterium]|nr:hypothetical protein [Clostridia bacterium]